MWKEISPEERMYWDEMAAREKERYQAEIEVYDGPVSVYPFSVFTVLLTFRNDNDAYTCTLSVGGFFKESKEGKQFTLESHPIFSLLLISLIVCNLIGSRCS